MRPVQTFLERLLDEAGAEELDGAVLACARAVETLPEEERESARAELDTLRELRVMVERHRRRARELQALFETAGDLSSVRDVEGVLQAIVRRGRQLLQTDVAYLMLVDPERGDTFMRVTEGTISPHFPEIRLPLGVGLGGRVAQGLAPHWTRNYLLDERFLHVIDGIVDEEQLVAILGVPLRVGHRLLGVLFAAERGERDFAQGEVSLLSSLADHAAIAIENASLFQETQEALGALSRAHGVIEANNLRLEKAVELHERLMALVVRGGLLQDLADAVVSVIGGGLLVIDDQARELARASAGGEDPAPIFDEALRLVESGNAPYPSTSLELAGRTGVLLPVVAGSERFGWIVFAGGEALDDDLRALERTASVMSLLLLNRRAIDEADNRVRGEILAELLISSPHDLEAIRRRAGLLAVDLDQPMVVVAAVPASGSVSHRLQAEAGSAVRSWGGLVTSYADRVVMLLPGERSDEWAATVAARLRPLQVTVGTSGMLTDLREVAHHADRARRVANLLVALGRAGEGASTDDLGIYGLLLSEAGEQHARAFIDTQLGAVRRYDAKRGTSLLHTLEVYFASESNVATAAERLFVHVNTLYQRLLRLDRILGDDWRTGDRTLELRLALRMERLRAAPEAHVEIPPPEPQDAGSSHVSWATPDS
ncbi:helix-turn-helix domain-containing protein [Nocardioides sp. LHG3406-4]|uniref:helix-turn-helix domain-containing protein n=1 Tax=Nocardioides sp. LHG3406-4 TaxID=2804575 RepID=UPI003CF4AE2A